MNAKALLLCIFLPLQAAAQGFAGLGTTPQDFTQPNPETVLRFPQDHGAHPDFRIEWWYVTANLTGPDGTPYGLQWTLFRSALAPERKGQEHQGWQSPQLWMGHAAVTTPNAHYVAERRARGGIGQAGVRAAPFEAWIDDWQMRGPDLDRVQLAASGTDFAYQVTLQATGPLVLQGTKGYSVKSAAGQASHYYSQPFYTVSGQLTLPEGPVPVTGTAWLDREWSSQLLAADQSGWDWFSLSFDDGARMMGFVLRGTQDFTAATWIAPDGTPTPFPDGAFMATPLDRQQVAGRDLPLTWRLRLPAKGVDVTIKALTPKAWMDVSVPYWEGPVTVSGSHAGVGYLEMTGYAP
ncbi:iron ABC transporter permease [Rhodobacter sp. TJ_12]|uniref:lipocalin-like domain-containing protein n=1 Tax=Rhodobacter sp. TJ_12 TaxID=2029399 RepID=UPI001CBE2730|nr:lipocalin-like domain-containing protein [Rhodobacter sp. TJ_12]MBZ4023444.1 iron ABC transporter permease [Rhodobacter sp. TJ_12]